MTETEYDHALRSRALLLRQRINKFAQCCNFATMRIQDELGPRIEALFLTMEPLHESTERLKRCMGANGL
jgi:hypothetical protein